MITLNVIPPYADRVYIVQPHPLGNESFVSIYYEVKRKGVEPMKPHVSNLHISDIAKFASDLVNPTAFYDVGIYIDFRNSGSLAYKRI